MAASSFTDLVLDTLRTRGAHAYVVGGAVRDLFLGRQPPDVDVVVEGPAGQAARELAQATGAHITALDEERGHYRLAPSGTVGKGWVDISSYGASLLQDLARRDFTIGAMAAPLESWPGDAEAALVDPFGGRADLTQKTLSAVSEKNLLDDPVRLVRAVRIANQLGFRIEPDTLAMVRRHAALLGGTTPERVRDEIYAVFASPRTDNGVRLLDALGLLGVVFPELHEARGVEQPKAHHYWDVFEHLLHCVGRAEAVMARLDLERDPFIRVVPWRPELEGYFDEVVADGQTRSTMLKLSALLHDIAKPQSKTFDPEGGMRFFGHSEAGAEMTRDMLGRWRCSRKAVSHVSSLVLHHLRPTQVAPQGGRPTDRAVYRFWRDLEGVAPDVLFLCMADYLAARGPEAEIGEWSRFLKTIDVILAGGFVRPSVTKPFLLLSGDEIMAVFGLTQGPEVGRLLSALRDAEADGRVQTRGQALGFVRGLI